MARAVEPIEISRMPQVVRIVEEVRKTKTPRVLSRKRKPVAILRPFQPKRAPLKKKSRRDYKLIGESEMSQVAATSRFPTIASTRGFAGKLATPMSWKETLEIAREDHLKRKLIA
jgi:hypothetical protein